MNGGVSAAHQLIKKKCNKAKYQSVSGENGRKREI
jgi:hypothetical protein